MICSIGGQKRGCAGTASWTVLNMSGVAGGLPVQGVKATLWLCASCGPQLALLHTSPSISPKALETVKHWSVWALAGDGLVLITGLGVPSVFAAQTIKSGWVSPSQQEEVENWSWLGERSLLKRNGQVWYALVMKWLSSWRSEPNGKEL